MLRMTNATRMDVVMPARAESAPKLRRSLRRFLEGLGLPAALVDDIVLAAGEAAGNAIEHAYREKCGDVNLHASVANERLTVEVRDFGTWRLDGDPERGRGLGIMRALVDHVAIESTREGTIVRFELSF
ncbi:MAG TPA: ATP-binding protein [Candidatus Baltobacteraceae bacterium]|nr:ATP-binding protein [Candidatus Baltobacteraceae bacterium]